MTAMCGRALAALVFLVGFAVGPARAATPYQATVTSTNCVGGKVCAFIFPPATGILTVSHLACNVVTASDQTVDGWVRYIRLSTSSSASPYLMVEPGGSTYSRKSWISTTNREVLYFVPARIAPKILVITNSDIVAPQSAVDQPTCFLSGSVEP